jgi:3-oxoacyl-[acyl-carrier-protein] synthase-3
VGGYLPEYILDNFELSRMVDTSDEWIMERIGIRERHILKGEGIGTSFLGERAVNDLLDKRGVNPKTIDLVICATVTPDMLFPSTANLIAYKTGMKNAYAFDLSAACSGFLFALITGAKHIESGHCKRVIVIGADKMSSMIDYEDRNTSPIFGDGGAAVLLEPDSNGYGIVDSELHSDASGAVHLYIKAGGSAYPPTEETVRNKWHYIHQEGRQVFKAAVSNMADVAINVMKRNSLTSDDIAYFVPHQANMRIIEAVSSRLNFPGERVFTNVADHGNTSAASVPLALYDARRQGRMPPGTRVLMTTFGSGLTWAAGLLRAE